MNRSDRMQPIKNLADSRERDAGKVLADARGVLDERERQLEQLRRYREDYQRQNAPGIGAVDPVRLQNYQAFLARLGDAIQQQERSVAEARAELERHADAWREKRVEAAALGRVVDRLKDGERRVEDRREQHDHDERALRSHQGPRE